MEKQKKRTRKPYDPGQPKQIKHIGKKQFAVQSFRDPEIWYVADTAAMTCTCPHFEKRVAPALDAGEEIDFCKHLDMACDEETRMVREKAETLTPAQLRSCLHRFSYRPEVEGTIREVLHEKLLAIVETAQSQVSRRSHCPV